MKMSFRLCFVVLFLLMWNQAYAQHPYGNGGQQSEGAATEQSVVPTAVDPNIIDPDTFPYEPPLVSGPAPTVGVGVSVNMLYSSHVKVYNIPVSYAVLPDLKVGMSFPYLDKTLTGEYTGQELTARGLGDISVWGKYRYGTESFIQGVTYFCAKLPTGDEKQFSNGQEQLALGTGSYDFIIDQTVSHQWGDFRFKGNIGYRFNTDSDYTETTTTGILAHFETREGNIFNYLAGAEYYTPIKGVIVYVNASGLVIQRSHLKETDVSTGAIIIDGEKNNRLKTLDLIAGIRVAINAIIAARLGVIIPVWTQFDPDVADPQNRDWAVDFGFGGQF
jgi:hypothetical protein